MNIALPPELEQFVAERVASGRSPSAADVIQEALRLLQADEDEQGLRLAALRADIAEGIASADRGELHSGEEVLAHLIEKWKKRAEA